MVTNMLMMSSLLRNHTRIFTIEFDHKNLPKNGAKIIFYIS